MPQLKNAKKALRKSFKRQEYNTNIKDNIKYLIKQTKKLAEAKDKGYEAKLNEAIKAIDKAMQKNVFKKNTAARKKSRLIKAARSLASKE